MMELDQESRELLQALARESAKNGDVYGGIDEARNESQRIYLKYAGSYNGPYCNTRDISVAGRIPCRVYQPPVGHGDPLPIMVYLHGGGWSLGDLDSYDALVNELCVLSGCLGISVDYRLAPEHPFPAGLRDCTEVMDWVFNHCREWGGDDSRVLLAGDSSGGNLAAAYALTRRPPRSLAGLALIYPVMDLQSPHTRYPSRTRYGNGDYLISRASFDLSKSWYLGDQQEAALVEASPILADNLQQLPPVITLTAGCDMLKDEANEFHQRLTDAGHSSVYRCFDGTLHAFLSFGVLSVSRKARHWLAEEMVKLMSP